MIAVFRGLYFLPSANAEIADDGLDYPIVYSKEDIPNAMESISENSTEPISWSLIVI